MSPKKHFDGPHTVTFAQGTERPTVGIETLSDASLAMLSGCTTGGKIHCRIDRLAYEMKVQGPFISSVNTVCIKKDENGLYLYVDYIRFADMAPNGLATMMLARMAMESRRLGLAHIRLLAAGGRPFEDEGVEHEWGEDDFAGYYVWPRLGFDADLKPLMHQEVNSEPSLYGCTRVRDVIATDRDWWKANGRGDYMEFDVSDNSYSWKTLNAVLTERGWSL